MRIDLEDIQSGGNSCQKTTGYRMRFSLQVIGIRRPHHSMVYARGYRRVANRLPVKLALLCGAVWKTMTAQRRNHVMRRSRYA